MDDPTAPPTRLNQVCEQPDLEKLSVDIDRWITEIMRAHQDVEELLRTLERLLDMERTKTQLMSRRSLKLNQKAAEACYDREQNRQLDVLADLLSDHPFGIGSVLCPLQRQQQDLSRIAHAVEQLTHYDDSLANQWCHSCIARSKVVDSEED